MSAKKNTTRRELGREIIKKPIIAFSTAEQPVATYSNTIQPVTTHYNAAAFTYVTQVRIDELLFQSIRNAVDSAIFGGNYSVESASHFIREALREHAQGKPLGVAHENGAKKSLSIRIDDNLKKFWETLPKRHRNNILERAIRTKLLSYQG